MKYLFAAIVLACASVAQAQDGAAYYGLQLGKFDYNDNDVFVDAPTSYRLMIGYQFSEHLGVEGGYGKSGDIRDSATFQTTFGPSTVNYHGEFSSLIVRLLGVMPFDNGFSVLGGLGYANMKLKEDIVVTGAGAGSGSGSTTGGEATYMAGAQYDLDRFAVRLAYEKYDFGGGLDVKETSVTFWYKL